jgi:hypothetical protein
MAILPMIPIHTLYWPNLNPTIVGYHKKCWAKLGIEITYTERQVPHDRWLDEVIVEKIDGNDAIGFVDIDCIAYSREAVEQAVDYALAAKSFIGIAQSANHFPPLLPVYAAPAFLIVSRAGYTELRRPALRARHRLDAAQNLSATADAIGFPYRAIYPRGYHRLPTSGAWRLGNYGYYGIGSEYEGLFHLYQTGAGNVDLFAETAERMLDGRGQVESFPYVCQALTSGLWPSKPTGDKWLRDLRYFLRRY